MDPRKRPMQTLEVGLGPKCGLLVHVLEGGVEAPCGISTWPHRVCRGERGGR